MAKQRYVSTHFWRDTYIDGLDPSEKLLFLYLLTNPETNICGIYEIPLRVVSSDTGFDTEMIRKMFAKLERSKRLYYIDGWVIMTKMVLHQTVNNPKIKAAIEREFATVPQAIVDAMDRLSIPYPYLTDRKLHFNLNLDSNSNLTDTARASSLVRFEKFWLAYPRKIGKQKCQAWWLRHKITDEMTNQMINTVEKYKATEQWKKDNGMFIPHPQTFLNRGSYEDEVEALPKAKQEFKSYASKTKA